MSFTEQDAQALVEKTLDNDSDGIVAWVERHIRTAREMHALMEFICRVISRIWPIGLTADAALGPGDFWAMEQIPGTAATPHGAAAARMVVAAMNEDWDSLTALILATLTRPEEEHGATLVHLLSALADGLRAIEQDRNKGGGDR